MYNPHAVWEYSFGNGIPMEKALWIEIKNATAIGSNKTTVWILEDSLTFLKRCHNNAMLRTILSENWPLNHIFLILYFNHINKIDYQIELPFQHLKNQCSLYPTIQHISCHLKTTPNHSITQYILFNFSPTYLHLCLCWNICQ